MTRGAEPAPGGHAAGHQPAPEPVGSGTPIVSAATEATVVFTRPPDLTAPVQPQPHAVPPPRLQLEQTVLLPRVLEPPEPPPSLAELARRHGLRPASARPSLRTYIGQVWRCREFTLAYANARNSTSFGTARLGRLWQLLTPLANAAVYYLVFGVVLGARAGVENFVGYLCVGMFIFTFTQNVAASAVTAVSGQLGLVRALQFPRACLPIAMTVTRIEGTVVSMIVLGGVVVATGEPVSLQWVYLVPALALQLLFNLGLAFVLARLGARIADVRQLLPHLLRVWMYSSGVLYSVDLFAQHLPGWAQTILHANPALVYIELARYALMENVPLTSSFAELWLKGIVWAVVACAAGFVFFWRAEAEYGRG